MFELFELFHCSGCPFNLKISLFDVRTLLFQVRWTLKKETIPDDGDSNSTFLLSLLDEEQRKKLEQKDHAFMQTFMFKDADVAEAEWKASEFNSKFAYSLCRRATYFIDP